MVEGEEHLSEPYFEDPLATLKRIAEEEHDDGTI
jgi:hypothetical protein